MREVEETDHIEAESGKSGGAARQQRGIALFDLDEHDVHYPGILLRTEPGLYLVRVSGPIELGTRLVMVDGPYRFEVQVLSCQPLEESAAGWSVSCRVLASREGSVRQEWRMPVNQPARLLVIGSGRNIACRLRDQSPFGMGIDLDELLPTGAEVSLSSADGFAHGEVRYCRPRPDGGYIAGILLREYTQKEEGFAPRLTRFLIRTLAQLLALAGFPGRR